MRFGKTVVCAGWLAWGAGALQVSGAFPEQESPPLRQTSPLRLEPLSDQDELYNKAYQRLWEDTAFWRSLLASPAPGPGSPRSVSAGSPIRVFSDQNKNEIQFTWSSQNLGRVRRIVIYDIAGERLAILRPGTQDSVSWNFGNRWSDIVYFQVWYTRNHRELSLPPGKIAIFR